jgi:hypothetical protein
MSRTLNGAEVILELLAAREVDGIVASPIAVMAPRWEALAARQERGARALTTLAAGRSALLDVFVTP